ncbi:unnamed protein product [Bursaphelenchus okinawaensis]|uniref:Uncharacterized protein n=1 Tax=Bursaphelenchus okinawaensis TaxID=465554 RepID=A0A811L2X6_9BILA|nr:unnamed protein product [Bursaphelenchus okinawaensis]CAG9115366.1 unnamed protein product [Bursaphelenchus okinawaensis]
MTTAWFRRLSRDQSIDRQSSDGENITKKISSVSLGHPINKHGPPPSSSRSRAFLHGLYQASKRRLSLPVDDENCDRHSVLGHKWGSTDVKKRHGSTDLLEKFENVRTPKHSSTSDLTRRVTVVDKPGQDKAHYTGLRGRTAKKLARRLVWTEEDRENMGAARRRKEENEYRQGKKGGIYGRGKTGGIRVWRFFSK